MRRSPIRHRVRAYIKESKPVVSYVRGHGQRAVHSSLGKVTIPYGSRVEGVYCDHEDRIKPEHCGNCSDKEQFKERHELRNYTVTLKYQDGESETLKLTAHSPQESLHLAEANSSRHDERPVEALTKNSVGEVVGKIGRALGHGAKVAGKAAWAGAKKAAPYAKKGLVYAGKGAVAVGKASALAAVRYAHDREAERLILEASSDNPAKAVRAKLKLKQKYPEYFEMTGWSPPTSVQIVKYQHDYGVEAPMKVTMRPGKPKPQPQKQKPEQTEEEAEEEKMSERIQKMTH